VKKVSDLIFGALGEDILLFLQTLQNMIFDLYFGVVTTLGDTLPILIIVVILYYTVDKDFINGLIYLLILSAHLNIVAKIFFHNPRPFVYDAQEFQVTTNVFGTETIWGADGYSFPSGHSMTQGTTWGYVLPKIRNIFIMIIGIILLVTIPLSRSYLGVHWPSDILFGVLFGIIVVWIYMKAENRYRSDIAYWSDSRKIIIGIIASLVLVVIGFLSFYLGTLFTFNQQISMTDPNVWLETDLGTYPGILAGIVVGQVLESKYVNFTTDYLTKTKVILRAIIGLVSVVILYLLNKAVDNIAEGFQTEILWITSMTNFLSYFIIAFFIAFVIPWFFTKIGK
jgi:membrane-associated phospholipid phosphatase